MKKKKDTPLIEQKKNIIMYIHISSYRKTKNKKNYNLAFLAAFLLAASAIISY